MVVVVVVSSGSGSGNGSGSGSSSSSRRRRRRRRRGLRYLGPWQGLILYLVESGGIYLQHLLAKSNPSIKLFFHQPLLC